MTARPRAGRPPPVSARVTAGISALRAKRMSTGEIAQDEVEAREELGLVLLP
ncbi:hypothetical protein ThrDRAFT_01429 [Frankia casuarinae]|nr:hypothetical protein CcI6DRAFT_01514 [Frankia sp. CcI6]EYT92853.1 hypothetical protein ThrDRAFT_01429 [Frankia casuarinae]KEZ36087.1 hypothetical protein CEDDRAFT_02559 [Frankia sp. CeD]KFB05743.1 hypothetical protein ALLO2DRAFT_01379 [Frankia sp. Allo2]OAA30345.1 hypothetical protein AAY23_1010149 [Frankia casuarinae]